ncbi:MAG: methyltransferase domain-containing protein [Planctomycetota bacterium]
MIAPRKPEPAPATPVRPEDLFTQQSARTYKEFWDCVGRTRAGAYQAVAGTLGTHIDTPLDEDDLSISGEPVVAIIADKLGVQPEHKVLEIGVGVGRLAEHMARRCRELHGVDISGNIITEARRRLAPLDNVRLQVLEHSGLEPLADAQFDRVYCHIVFIHIDREDLFHYLRESFRVLRPGGRAYFQTNNLLHPSGFRSFEGVVNEALREGHLNRGHVHFLTAPELRCYVTAAGFRILEDRSHLELTEQAFDFITPDVQWDHFLIAVVEKPR